MEDSTLFQKCSKAKRCVLQLGNCLITMPRVMRTSQNLSLGRGDPEKGRGHSVWWGGVSESFVERLSWLSVKDTKCHVDQAATEEEISWHRESCAQRRTASCD